MMSCGNSFPRLVLQHVKNYVLSIDFLVSVSSALEIKKMLLDLPIKITTFIPVAPSMRVYSLFIHSQ